MTDRVHVQAEIDTWGTILLVDAASTGVDEAALSAGIDEVKDYVKLIDELFSPFKETSEVSKLRRKEITIEQASSLVQEIWQLCERAKKLTRGSFDPWAVKKGFDPSGYVKGWAADNCIKILKKHGAENIQINAAGDISVAGGLSLIHI